MSTSSDIRPLRELAKRYAEIAASAPQQERRDLWRAHNSLQNTRTPVLATFGMWNVWCREVFADAAMACRDPFYREFERSMRMAIFAHESGDDQIIEPWVTMQAVRERGWGTIWGVKEESEPSGVEGGAWKFRPVLETWEDVRKLSWPKHVIDEAATERNAARLVEAVGDIVPVNVSRAPVCVGFMSDIATSLARLRGLEQLMMDMCEFPEELKKVLAFMRDGILKNQRQAEVAGDFGQADGHSQQPCYAQELADPAPNVLGRKRKQLWGFCAAQELTLVSPEMHEEFMLEYQRPIMEHFGLAHYGCCEDLTRKIDVLRKVKNLRTIAVAPRADLRTCAQQVGRDYVLSWRPNPTDMVCAGFNEELIRRTVREALAASQGCVMHVHLKDIETVEGDPTRLKRWVAIVKDECAKAGR